jgi:hypothetical protein
MQCPVITWRCAPATADQLAAWRRLWTRLLSDNSEVQEVSEAYRLQPKTRGGSMSQRRATGATSEDYHNDTPADHTTSSN